MKRMFEHNWLLFCRYTLSLDGSCQTMHSSDCVHQSPVDKILLTAVTADSEGNEYRAVVFYHAVAEVISFYKQVTTFLLRSLLFLFVSVESTSTFFKEIIIGHNPFNLHMWYLIMLMIINITLRGENCEQGWVRRVVLWVGGGREEEEGWVIGEFGLR